MLGLGWEALEDEGVKPGPLTVVLKTLSRAITDGHPIYSGAVSIAFSSQRRNLRRAQ